MLLIAMSLPRFVEPNIGSVCKPDGTFDLSWNDYTPWNWDSIFAINLSYGSYLFGVPKLIDVSWDIVSLVVLVRYGIHILLITLGSWKRRAGTTRCLYL